ncbi:interleukin-31 receptor subunit alpha-like [Anabas testudineus]|uniref:Fibronectin type-III domain-containing protein n=1 Tax=Anabas testudineus TaxID=64144 RepID=A0A3Q1J3H3_ANATE|nr:interleukin-31 receptor subunit alpha-like [Anabas testudineus]
MCHFLVLFIVGLTSSVCKGQHAKPCNVVPKDQYIKAGSDTEVVCQTSCVPGKVYWTLNNRPIDESLSKTVNSSHTVLTLRNFTHPNATLQCHSADTQQILGGTYIRTYSKPNKLSCFLHYENEDQTGVPRLLTCNWEHQIISSLTISYTILYATLSRPSEISEICSSHETTCTCKDKVRVTVKGIATVRAQTEKWVHYSDPYEFYPYNILKMSRPQVEVTAFSDHLLVKWIRSVSSETCHCQVKYDKALSDGTPVVINKTLEPRQDGKEIIENVDSCTKYKILVRCAIDKAPWSNWSREKTVLTKLNKRHVNLRLWRKIAKPEENGFRKVHAMWTEIPSTCQGTFTYAVKRTPNNDVMTGDNYTDILCGNSTCDVVVNEDAHRINLRVLENETLLAQDSVYVPATGESLPQVTDIRTSTLEGVILVSWKAPVELVSGYMIDWTHNGNLYYWKESKHTNTTLFGLLEKMPYNITVTPLFDNETGHGTQVHRVCSRVGDPGNVTIISVEANDKSVFVSWNTKSQEECSGAVINYTVFFGAQNGPMLNVTVDSTRRDINLKELHPNTQYSVYVEATALTGSTKSSARLFKTKRFDPRLPLALGVCGSIIIVLVLSLGLFCAIQWKKFSEKPVPNPGLSSVALWSSPNHQKWMRSFQPFSNPSESPFDQIFTEEHQKTSTSPLAASCTINPASEQTEEYADPAIVDKSVEQHLRSPGESTALMSLENRPFSPYRSQSSVESSASMTVKQFKRVPVKQTERTAPVTVYVTLDMYEQGQSR